MLGFYKRDLIKLTQVIIYDGTALVLLLSAVFLFLALMTYHPMDPCFDVISHQEVVNSTGAMGAWLASFLLNIFGIGAWAIPLVCLLCFYQLSKGHSVTKSIFYGCGFMVLSTLALPEHWASYPGALAIITHAWIPQYVFAIVSILLLIIGPGMLFRFRHVF